MRDETDETKLTLIVIGTIVVLLLLGFGGYWIDRTFFYPQIRANTVANPDRSIANRAWFHSEIGAIIAADQNIQSQEQQIAQFKADNPRPWDAVTEQQYSDLQTQLTGLEQIRSSDINEYNARSANPDYSRDRDSCLPVSIDPTESITAEIQNLTTISC